MRITTATMNHDTMVQQRQRLNACGSALLSFLAKIYFNRLSPVLIGQNILARIASKLILYKI
jgi:hypothetical protein